MSEQSQWLNRKIQEGFDEAVPDAGTRKILIHAIDVFARKGLSGAKIRDIAAQAGFSQGYVYNYFKSKEAIFTRIVDLAADGAAAMVGNAASLPGTPYQRIYWLTEALLSPGSVVMQHWRLIMLQVSTSEAVPEEARQIARDKMQIPIALLIPIIREGQQLGEITGEDPVVLALTFFSIVQGLGITRVQGGPDMPFPSTGMILHFLRYDGRPAKE